MHPRTMIALAGAGALASACAPGESGSGVDGRRADLDAAVDGHLADVPPVRFVMMGDTGTGGPKQYAVADAVRTLCAIEGCDFVVLAGDNLYPRGADSVTDPIWQTAFELPYAGIELPFHATLGNHDFGAGGHDWPRGDQEIAYTAQSSRWHLPAAHYTMRQGPVGFLMLDTTRLLLSETSEGDQRAWWPEARAELNGSPWVIAVGHHPYRSNGTHGNAGTYGNDDGDGAAAEELPGVEIKQFFDEYLCGQVDLYVSGHDHDREWLNAPEVCGGTELVVAGAGGTVSPFVRTDTPAWWHDDQTAGFLYVTADEHTLRGRFVNADGTVAFERVLTR